MATVTVCDACGETINLGIASLVSYDKEGNSVNEYDLCRQCSVKAAKAINLSLAFK